MELFKHFTDISQGVRRSGAAAADMAHVACGAPITSATALLCTTKLCLHAQAGGPCQCSALYSSRQSEVINHVPGAPVMLVP